MFIISDSSSITASFSTNLITVLAFTLLEKSGLTFCQNFFFLPYGNLRKPHVVEGDGIFAGEAYKMIPYPQQYQQKSRFTTTITTEQWVFPKNFVVLANRWRVLQSAINLSPNKIIIISGALVLRNFLQRRTSASKSIYIPAVLADYW